MLGSFDYPLLCPAENFPKLAAYVRDQGDWFHTFSFNDGLQSRGRDPSAKKLHYLCLPNSLSGQSILDVGAYDGYFSFHCEARGARVTASDKFVWEWPQSTALKNFEAVHAAMNSSVKVVNASVETLADTFLGEQFDVVLLLGVLYHAPDMIGYLRNVYAVTRHVCILETFMDALDLDSGYAAVYGHGELNNDATNWFGPNLRGLEILVTRAGFSRVEFQGFWDINTRSAFEGHSIYSAIRTGRAVFHVYK